MRRNPLIFDNRFDPETVRRSRSRVVASLVAPPRQRAQVERLADSPHTFRVVLVDEASGYYDNEGLATLSQPGCITLVVSLSDMASLDFYSRNKSLPKTAGVGRFSAFTLLHRMGDALFIALGPVVSGRDPYWLDLLKNRWVGAFDRIYFPGEVSDKTYALGRQVYSAPRTGAPISRYIREHTNSQMSRDGTFDRDDPNVEADANQCVADWVALSEMPSARARLGRGEPWLLFPPKPGEYEYVVERVLVRYVETINTYFPLLVQSLLDDLDGAVIRI